MKLKKLWNNFFIRIAIIAILIFIALKYASNFLCQLPIIGTAFKAINSTLVGTSGVISSLLPAQTLSSDQGTILSNFINSNNPLNCTTDNSAITSDQYKQYINDLAKILFLYVNTDDLKNWFTQFSSDQLSDISYYFYNDYGITFYDGLTNQSDRWAHATLWSWCTLTDYTIVTTVIPTINSLN